MTSEEDTSMDGIAIIGMTGRFPQAASIEAFWQLICEGKEAVTVLSPEDDPLLVRYPALKENPNYIPAGAFLDDVDLFDAPLFGYTSREAQILDPQQRIFLECAWEVLERAGYNPQQYTGRIGVYAGAGMSGYMLNHIYPNQELRTSIGFFQTMISNEKDFLATRVSYKLGLTGPSISVQTGCSTSLTAIALGCQSLSTYQCDLALAGGVSIAALEKGGYIYEQGGIGSPDGHCRAFDARAQGTVFGNGVGIVALKRLDDALRDGDQIYSVIKGIAINNDGAHKIGYTAPSIDGQTEVIAEALALAGVEPESIGYVEAHGTGTYLGDPIEIAALTQAFNHQGQLKPGSCAIGSVKTNIGHLDSAAGVASLIKASLALYHRSLPPSLHYSEPNPQIDFAHSPFYVNKHLQAWPEGEQPRRAGVSSFGIGGTNVHAILEEPPVQASNHKAESTGPQLLLLSARTPTALETLTDQLVRHLQTHPDLHLADVAATLQVGRQALPHRRMLVCETLSQAATRLQDRDPQSVFSAQQQPGDNALIWLFPGYGAEYVQMGRDLYESEPTYRYWVDHCSELARPLIDGDLRHLLFPTEEQEELAKSHMQQTHLAMLALFVTEYALAQLLISWDLHPHAMLGHSLGEYVAASLAGVFSLEDALLLVSARSQFMQEMTQPGTMLSIPLPEHEVLPLLGEDLSLAAVNAPAVCVISGTEAGIERVKAQLSTIGIVAQRVNVTRATHSVLMEPMLAAFRKVVQRVSLHTPQIPYVSCMTGTWITAEEVTTPDYWVQHVRQTVRFVDGLATLCQQAGPLFIEVGPRQVLTSLVKLYARETHSQYHIEPVMRHPRDPLGDRTTLLTLVGRLWLRGVHISFPKLQHTHYQRLLLPTYPFERRRYWIEVARPSVSFTNSDAEEQGEQEMETTPSQDTAARAHLLTAYAAPHTETERRVTAIWEEYFGQSDIGVHDNFFELGGHSLLSIRLLARIRDVFQIELSETSLYQFPTIAGLCSVIETSAHTSQAPLVPVARGGLLPASWHQKWRWDYAQKYPEKAELNNLAVGWELHGSLDHALFEGALNEVVQRQEAMRTSFTEVDGQLMQVIAPILHVSVPLIDLTNVPPTEQMTELIRRATEQRCTPFVMDGPPPLWHISLYRLEESRFALVLTAHHSLWDGNSYNKVIREMTEIMRAKAAGETPNLPVLSVQYADFVQWHQQQLTQKQYEQCLAYWREQLRAPITPLLLPTDRPRQAAHGQNVEHGPSKLQRWSLKPALTKKLKAMCQEEGVTLYTGYLAIVKLLCHLYTGLTDILIMTAFADRDHPELEPLVAPFANFAALRTDLSGDPEFLELLRREGQTLRGAIAHRELDFSQVISELHPAWYSDLNPFVWLLIVQYEPTYFTSIGDLRIGRRLWFRRSPADFYVSLYDLDDHIEAPWEYDTELFEEATVVRMMQDFHALIEQVLADPRKPLSAYAISSNVHDEVAHATDAGR